MGSRAAPPQGVGKFDTKREANGDGGGGDVTVDVWMPEPYQFCGEPMYAPRPREDAGETEDEEEEEDDGYILTVLYDGSKNESEMVVLLAADVSAGPVARIPLGFAVPHGLYGCFAPGSAAAWNSEEIGRRAKLSDKMENRGAMWNEVKSDFSGLGLRLDDIEEYFGDVM